MALALLTVEPGRATMPRVDFDRLLQLLRALNDEGVDYVVVGGIAMGFHGLVRATEDIDLFVRPDADNITKVKSALRSVWNDPAVDDISSEDLAGDYAVVRYGPPDEPLSVDLIGHLGDALRYADLVAERQDVEGTSVNVASPATLYRMKRATARPIDRADAAALREKFGLKD